MTAGEVLPAERKPSRFEVDADLKMRAIREDLELINEAVAALRPKVRGGDTVAINCMRGVLEFRAALLGTFSPLRFDAQQVIEQRWPNTIDKLQLALERMARDGKLSPGSEAKVRLLGSQRASDCTLSPGPKNHPE